MHLSVLQVEIEVSKNLSITQHGRRTFLAYLYYDLLKYHAKICASCPPEQDIAAFFFYNLRQIWP